MKHSHRFDFLAAGRRVTELMLDSIGADMDCPFCGMESRTAHEDHCEFFEWSEDDLRDELKRLDEEAVP